MFGRKKIICPFCLKYCDNSDEIISKIRKSEYYCPECDSQIPQEVLTSRLFPIMVVGASGSGKTHFLTVMAHLLCQGTIWPSYWTCERIPRFIRQIGNGGEKNMDREMDDEFVNWEEWLYPQKAAAGMILKQTDQRSETDPPLSLVIHLSYMKGVSNCLKEPYRKQDVLLAFTDAAGEDLTPDGWSSVTNKYPIIRNKLAEGIIALINPMQLSTIRQEYNVADSETKKQYEQSGLAGSVYATLQGVLANREFRNPMKKIPIAACLTKTNAFVSIDKLAANDDLVGDLNTFNLNEEKEGFIQLQKLEDISTMTKAFLAKMDENVETSNKLSNVMKGYKYHSFFATDALGNAIQTTRTDVGSGAVMFDGKPEPLRVLDPLFWILWQHGLVGGC